MYSSSVQKSFNKFVLEKMKEPLTLIIFGLHTNVFESLIVRHSKESYLRAVLRETNFNFRVVKL